MAGLPENARGIPVRFTIDYLKKARGPLLAEGRCQVPDWSRDGETEVVAEISDESGEVVARARVTWRVGPLENG
jgi:acyl-coenzyme A thioesterase PaaI-like protein